MKQQRFFEKKETNQGVKHKSDTFKCSSCGRTVILKVYGDQCTCSACGGTMYRQD